MIRHFICQDCKKEWDEEFVKPRNWSGISAWCLDCGKKRGWK